MVRKWNDDETIRMTYYLNDPIYEIEQASLYKYMLSYQINTMLVSI